MVVWVNSSQEKKEALSVDSKITNGYQSNRVFWQETKVLLQ